MLPEATVRVREPCKHDLCPDRSRCTFYCVNCDCSFCDTCWDKQPPHKPNKRGSDGHAHEKIDRLVVERYRNILEPPSSIDEQEALYKDDEDSTWFGISHNRAGDPVFEDYERYATLMAENPPQTHGVRYPQLVSFIGQTGAGKSTIVKMLINHQDMKTNSTSKAKFPSPVVGSVNDNIPVSADVHLYAVPNTISTNKPLLFVDCEGLEGGQSLPKTEVYKMQDRAFETCFPLENSSSSSPWKYGKLIKKSNKISRKISWAIDDTEKSKREYAVTELYPKELYAFSDVVVFVLRNPKTFESAVLKKLIAWASASFEKSFCQPVLPHIIIVLNATDLAIEASQWDVKKATWKFFADVETPIDKIPAFQGEVEYWRSKGYTITTTKDLLGRYYSSITVVRIPAKGRYMLIDEQVAKLYGEIIVKCSQSHTMKKKNLDDAFNFMEVALKINPIPSDFGGNILKLAVAIKDHHPSWIVAEIFEHLSLMVVSCIMLDTHRQRRLGTLNQLLENYYMDYCEQAFAGFCDFHWQCSFQKKNHRCANVFSGHAKGHQNAMGKVLAYGDYIPSYHYKNDLCIWLRKLEKEISKIEGFKDARPNSKVKESPSDLHLENMKTFYRSIGSASNFRSYYTCYCCLRKIPIHPLACGHVLCSPCVRFYGVHKGRVFMEMLKCPICQAQDLGPLIEFMPPLAGVRILCLDGGGIRGIVELEVLKAIEMELPLNIPVRNFFDLIVGTNTGGIISLGLGVEGWSIDKCIDHFEKLCTKAFTPRLFHGIPGLEQLSAMSHKYSKYKTKPLEEVLKATFSVSDQPLFGGKQDHCHSSVKVAVTSTTTTDVKAILLTNYNRSHKKDHQVASYLFERAEKPEDELNVWEAARATSAAPSYFKTFTSKRSRRGYLDGALYHNHPVRVADLERRLIWPDTEFFPPDILLSIGTGCNSTIRQEAQNSLHYRHQKPDSIPSRSNPAIRSAQQNISEEIQKTTYTSKIIKLMKTRAENILDTEMSWLEFMSDVASRGDKDARTRYRRINPNLREDPPKLDDVTMLPHLRLQMNQIIKQADFQRQIREVARQLVASSFYVEVPSIPTSPTQDFGTFAVVEIHCKFPSASQEIRYLGEYLKNFTTKNFQPYFIIWEKSSTLDRIKIPITQSFIQRMMMNASFEVSPVSIPVSSESAIITISLSLFDGEENPISGFPRALFAKKAVKTLSPFFDEPKEQIKPKLGSRHGSSSRTSESFDIVFPELQKLPKEAKLPIRDFLQGQISSLKGEKEIPRRLWLLAEATKDLADGDNEEGDHLTEGAGGPYGSILHTASMVGNDWLVKLQIQAGVDVSAVDNHFWTALMVATAQGHTSCANLLAEHMETGKAIAEPQVPGPSGLAKAGPKTSISMSCVELDEAVQFRSDHPIPPHCRTFYYEILILNNGPLGLIGLGLCRPEALVDSMPGCDTASWGYHGDDGHKYNSTLGTGLRYSEPYNTGDTIGCGIDMRTRKLFFTKNGFSLGVAFTNVEGMLFPVIFSHEWDSRIRANFGTTSFFYDIAAHDWNAEDSALVRAHRGFYAPEYTPVRYSYDFTDPPGQTIPYF